MRPTTYTPEQYGPWIAAVNDEAGDRLTPFERQFMESVTDQFERTGRLSEKQVGVLETIFAEKTK